MVLQGMEIIRQKVAVIEVSYPQRPLLRQQTI